MISMIALSILFERYRKVVVIAEDNLLVTLEVMQKTMRTNLRVMVSELRILRDKGFWSFVQL